MHYVRESYVYYLWSVLLSLYDRSALCHALTAAGHWCKRQIADSKAAAVLSREGLLTQSWESSRLCRYLTYLANSPIYLLRIVYQKLKSLFDGSFFAGLIFQMGQETAIAQSWLILLLWIIPYEYWSNGYTLAGFFLLLCLFCVRGMHDRRAKLDIPSMGVFTTVFFLCVCLAAPLSVYPSLSGRFLMYHAGAGLCLLLTISAVRHVDDLKRLAAGGCCAMAISSAYAVYQRIQGVDVKSAYVDAALNPDMPGRGGWSWYTGAAGWFLRTSVEELLGIRTEGGRLRVEPKLPSAWNGYRLKYRAGGVDYRIKVARGAEGWETEIRKSEKD